jgi:hypothetical protein
VQSLDVTRVHHARRKEYVLSHDRWPIVEVLHTTFGIVYAMMLLMIVLIISFKMSAKRHLGQADEV